MSNAEELLASLTEKVPVHEHTVTDSDTYFIIDPVTRRLENTARKKNVLMQFDHESEVFTFEIPRYVEGHDMMLCNKVYAHWNNIGTKTGNEDETLEETADLHQLTDLQVNTDKPDTVICTWAPTRQSTQLIGILSFLIQYACVDEDGNVTYEWHTDFYEDMEIRKGRKNSPGAVSPYSDILEQWYAKLFGIGDSVVHDISLTLSAAQQALQEESANQQSAIAAKGQETLNSIPPDYTEMYKMSEEAMRTKADAIVVEAEGETISVSNASDNPLQGLRIFGKTKQVKTNGYQLFDAGAIASNTNGGVTVANNRDGSFTVSGNGAATESFIIQKDYTHEETLELLKIGTLHASVTKTHPYWYIQIRNNSTVYFALTHSKLSCEISEEILHDSGTFMRVGFYCDNGSEIVPGTIKPMLYQDGDGTWEPYSGGKPSPSPNWPQELVSVENAEVVVYGKNLLEVSAESETINGVTFTVNENGSVSVDGTATANAFFILKKRVPVAPDETYRMTGCPNGGSLYTYMMYLHNNTTGIDAYDTGDGLTVTPTSDNNNVVIVVYKGVTANNLVFWPMIRVASFADGTFEPYKPVQTLATKRTLRSIAMPSGKIVEDELVYNYQTDTWQLIQRIYALNMNNADVSYSLSGKTGRGQLVVSPTSRYPKDQSEYGTVCNMATINLKAMEAVDGEYYENPANVVLVGAIDETEESMRTKYADVEYLYVLATPIVHDLTTEEVLAFKALRTNKPNTVIQNGVGAYMIAEYAADTELYIRENQFRPTDEQMHNAIDSYFTKNNITIPSDDHIRALIDEVLGGIVNGEY